MSSQRLEHDILKGSQSINRTKNMFNLQSIYDVEFVLVSFESFTDRRYVTNKNKKENVLWA